MIDVAPHVDYARQVALRTMRYWPRSWWEDGISDGMVGLMQAAHAYQPGLGATFRTFAHSRIRGAVIDGLRAWRGRTGDWGFEGRGHRQLEFYSYDEPDYIDKHGEPVFRQFWVEEEILDGLLEDEDRQLVVESIARLPERQRMIVALYYFEQMTLREIGELFGLTESRLSQIVAGIENHMRSYGRRFDLAS